MSCVPLPRPLLPHRLQKKWEILYLGYPVCKQSFDEIMPARGLLMVLASLLVIRFRSDWKFCGDRGVLRQFVPRAQGGVYPFPDPWWIQNHKRATSFRQKKSVLPTVGTAFGARGHTVTSLFEQKTKTDSRIYRNCFITIINIMLSVVEKVRTTRQTAGAWKNSRSPTDLCFLASRLSVYLFLWKLQKVDTVLLVRDNPKHR